METIKTSIVLFLIFIFLKSGHVNTLVGSNLLNLGSKSRARPIACLCLPLADQHYNSSRQTMPLQSKRTKKKEKKKRRESGMSRVAGRSKNKNVALPRIELGLERYRLE